MDKKIISLKSLLICLVYLLLVNSKGSCQDSFLLTNEDLEGYILESQNYSNWPISADSLIKQNVIEQKWSKTQNDEYYITYCEFESEVQAIKAVAYAANSNAWSYFFGSPTGIIFGDASFVLKDWSALYFQKWNIGVKIFNPVSNDLENIFNNINISNKILTKIHDNVSSDIIAKENELLKYQLSISDYQLITSECYDLLTQFGYTELNTENSKWIIPNDSLFIGLRKYWSKGNSTFSIDIARYSNVIDAQLSGKYKSNISKIPFCLLNNDDTINNTIEEWIELRKFEDTVKEISIIGEFNSLSIHFYYYNNSGIDKDFFKSIIKANFDVETSIFNYKDNDFYIYPNPFNSIFNIQTDLSNLYGCELYNSKGQLIKIFDIYNGLNTIDISDLRSGLYFIHIQTQNKMVVKRIVKL